MESRLTTKTARELDLEAVQDFLKTADKAHSELEKERTMAVRSGRLKLALQLSRKLRRLHELDLQSSLRGALAYQAYIREKGANRTRPVIQTVRNPKELECPEDAQELEEMNEAEHYDEEQEESEEDFTTECIRNKYAHDMNREKSFLERLQTLSRYKGDLRLVRQCGNEIMNLSADLMRGRRAISHFEVTNPSVCPEFEGAREEVIRRTTTALERFDAEKERSGFYNWHD